MKVKLFVCLAKYNALKTYGRVNVWCPAFVISALVRDERLASRLGRFIPRERALGTPLIGGWLAP
jgi:hypothetical protein